MEYYVYQIEEENKVTDVVVIRQGWGYEEEIYKAVGNAIVLPRMGHIFLMPLNTKGSFIPQMPPIVMDGVYYGFDESCQKCVSRTRKITQDGCKTCVFSPVGTRREFNFNALQRLFKKERAGHIDILSQMEKNNIYEIYHLYWRFQNFYSKELPLQINAFMSLVSQFDVKLLFYNEQEMFFQKNNVIYQAQIHSEFVDDTLHRRDEKELRESHETTKIKIKELNRKKEFLQRILKI